MKNECVLEVKNLHTVFSVDKGEVSAVNGVSFTVKKGEILGIVGESGSGKSVTAYSIMGILSENGRVKSGEILYKGEDITKWDKKRMAEFRGKNCAIVFQDPMTALNPLFTVGDQITEAIRIHTDMSRAAANKKALEMLRLVGVNEPERRLKQYPFELSGGMRQRIMIAIALVCEPDILIADEPTTALDVTIQAQILRLMSDLQKKLGMAIIIITHDLGVVADMCDRIIVMYGGKICESATADEIFGNPCHEYTKGLLKCIPDVKSRERLVPIPGSPINMQRMPSGCPFFPRCENAMKICVKEMPALGRITNGHYAACWMNSGTEAENNATK